MAGIDKNFAKLGKKDASLAVGFHVMCDVLFKNCFKKFKIQYHQR
jgi:hypothetical protein